MLPIDGDVIAPPDVRPEAWIAALSPESAPLALAPASSRGWFGGMCVVAWAPLSFGVDVPVSAAAARLQDCLSYTHPCLGVALLTYDGDARYGYYTGGILRTEDGWRVWGTITPSDVPEMTRLVPEVLPRTSPLMESSHTDLTDREFRSRTHAVIDSILDGDVYVLNLTRQISGSASTSPPDAFATLLSRSGADMGAYWATPELTIVSASPERFARVSDGSVEVAPIKGTRPRAQGSADHTAVGELRLSEKETAEHVMIVDLIRNDLGRVCQPGSVEVDPLFEIITTPYCHQMVSTVTGRLQPETGLSSLLAAVFPCGSVTGAPKKAAISTIAKLEASPRGSYTGSLIVAIPGEMDSSVLIRTAEYSANEVRWGTGGGITVDSDPAEEWLETVLKASPFMGDCLPAVSLRETCRVVDGVVPLLSRHLARLAAGGCGPTILSRVRADVQHAIDSHDGPVGRLSVTIDPSGSVQMAASNAPSSLDVIGGVTLAAVVSNVPALPAGAAKPLNRAQWDRAQRVAVGSGANQAVLVDATGRIIDAATANIWIRVGTRLLTPCAPPAVDGIARGVVFDYARKCGYEPAECDLFVNELADADEVFLSNAVAGVVPVRNRGGEAVDSLANVFDELFSRIA